MNFIIYVAGRIRNGQRVGLPEFPYVEKYGKYVYQGRELTLAEFNAAAEAVFTPNYRNNGFSFCPMALAPVEVVEQPADAPVDPPAAEEAPVEETIYSDGNKFTLDGAKIMFEGRRVAGLYGEAKVLRVVAEFEYLRPEIEAWLPTVAP